LRKGLRELGYLEGKNIDFEYRNAEGKLDRLSDLVVELLRLKADVIVATSGAASLTAKQATSVVPIVMTISGDPVASGLAASLARPGGNVTGLTIVSTDLSGKRLEVLKETIPGLSRIAILWRPRSAEEPDDLRETKKVARNLGLQVQSLRVQAPHELNRVFEAAIGQGANAVVPLAHRFIAIHRKRIIELAKEKRLPVMYANRTFVEVGGLMSYGPNHSDLVRRAAFFVDKILKGAKPAELPIEQPTKFELVINRKTAKQIGVAIPPEVLMWADEVIQ
jgi:putative ABC transport system substrate-binding protein